MADKEYYETEAKRKWQKEHTTVISVRLQHKTDSDILQYLEGKSKQGTIKAALREYMAAHKDGCPK